MVPTNQLARKKERTQQESRVFPPSFQKSALQQQQQHTLSSSWNPPDPPHPAAGVMAALTDTHLSSGSGASLHAQPLEAVAVDSSFLSAAGRASCGDASVPVCCRGKSGECEEEEEEEAEGVSCREAQHSVCSVCGNKADGNFFGATVCLPCKSFFIRCTKDGDPSILQQCHGNCDVTKQLRNRCQFCRFQRCLDVGMTRKEKPEVVLAEEGQALCRVCGDLANGVHFGVITCEGCKKFFRRGLKEHESYMCRSSKDCVLNPRNRNNCRYCRYHKCLAAGMSRDAIKMGRPRKISSKADTEDMDLVPTITSAEAPSVDTPCAKPDPQAAPQLRPMPRSSSQRPGHPQQPPVSLVQNLTPSSTGGTTDWVSPSGSLWNTVSAGTTTSPASISSVSLATAVPANLPSSGSQTSSLFSAAAQDCQVGSLKCSVGNTESPVMSATNSSAVLSFPVTSFAVDPSAVISEQTPQAGFAGLARSNHVSLAPSKTGQSSWTPSSSTGLSMSHSRLLKTAGRAKDEHNTTPSTAGRMADVFPLQQSSQMEDFNIPLTFQSYQAPLSSNQPGFSDLFASDAAGFSSASHACVTTNNAPVAASQASASLPFPGPPALEPASTLLSSAASCTGTCGRKDCPFYARTSNTNNLYQHFSQNMNSAAQPPLQRFVKSLQELENSSGFSHSSGTMDVDISIPDVQAAGAAQRQSAKVQTQLDHQDSTEDLTRAVKIPRRDDTVQFDPPFGLPQPGGQAQQVSDTTQNAGTGTLTASLSAPSSSHAEQTKEPTDNVWSQRVHPSTHSQTAPRAEKQPWTSEDETSPVQNTERQPQASESVSPSASSPQWTQEQGHPSKTGGKDWRRKGVYDPYLDKDEMFRVNQVFVSLNTLMEAAEGERNNPWGSPSSGQGGPSEFNLLEDLMQTEYRFSPRHTIHYWHTLASRCQQVPVGGQMPGKCQHILDSMLKAYTELIEASDNSKYESVETGQGGSIWPKDDRVKTYWNAIQRRIVRGTQCCIKCAYQVPGVERLHPNDKNLLIRRDVIFSMGLLSASTVFFDADKKDFKHFFNWKLEPDHPMAMFRQRLVAVGRKIFDLQMDLNEVALIFALNSVCLDIGEFTDPDTLDSVMLDLLMTLNCYISCLRKMSPKHRMQSLFTLMPRMRMMGMWHGSLLKNMKFDTNLMKIDINNIQLDDAD